MKLPVTESTRQRPETAVYERIPASFFSMVMGIAGLGLAWRAAAVPLRVPIPVGNAIVAAASLLWLALALCYAAKWLREPARARAEWKHAIQGAFVGLLPATLLLLLPAGASYLGVTAKALFFIAAAAQSALGAAMVARWFSETQDPDLATPAWHLAVVAGHLFAANAAASLGYKLTGWGFFGAGVISWLLIESIVFARLMQREPLPPPLRPLIAIELAPPAVIVIAYLALVDGEVDAVALALLGYSLFVGAILLFLARYLTRAPFGPGYWAFTFPFAALSVAAWRVAVSNASEGAFALALVLFAVANVIVLWVAARTVLALRSGTFMPLNKMGSE
ncbi:MAG: dicarboxylate transporter/tellurite-resistance protein TehA [Betaproteobacteria bacterium]|nr:dicarboxylate transporter/tellurite-resistance protein TehA [Betaproteobacteria bacterium]